MKPGQTSKTAGAKQVVILGAGLDGRAWRMAELKHATVFEVDHPDSQREKRAMVANLAPTARDLRYVGVDFERDDLGGALAKAGHDPAIPTTWIWEGVAMHLRPASIEATLEILAARSAPGSHLVVNYHRPAAMLIAVGLVLRFLGEPLRSRFTPGAMRELLGRHGFAVAWDESLAHLGAKMDAGKGKALERFDHIALVSAARRDGAMALSGDGSRPTLV